VFSAAVVRLGVSLGSCFDLNLGRRIEATWGQAWELLHHCPGIRISVVAAELFFF